MALPLVPTRWPTGVLLIKDNICISMLKNTTYDIYSASGRSTFSQGLVADAAFQTEYIISTILFYTNIKIYTDG